MDRKQMKPSKACADERPREFRLFKKLDTPIKIQKFLNSIEYDDEPGTRSPLWVIKEKKANCFEGALFAAAALREIGYGPLILDMAAENDDDHVIAVYRKDGHWGAVAKSNFVTLRFREPVYRSIRELVMSYFDFYFNTLGDKTLRSYSLPYDLSRFDGLRWMTTEEDISDIGDALNDARHIPVLTPRMARSLHRVDRKLFRAALLGSKKSGLFVAKRRKR
jgi:hypothetical protein